MQILRNIFIGITFLGILSPTFVSAAQSDAVLCGHPDPCKKDDFRLSKIADNQTFFCEESGNWVFASCAYVNSSRHDLKFKDSFTVLPDTCDKEPSGPDWKMVMQIRNYYLFINTKQIDTYQDWIYIQPWPSFHESQKMCKYKTYTGAAQKWTFNSTKSDNTQIAQAYNEKPDTDQTIDKKTQSAEQIACGNVRINTQNYNSAKWENNKCVCQNVGQNKYEWVYDIKSGNGFCELQSTNNNINETNIRTSVEKPTPNDTEEMETKPIAMSTESKNVSKDSKAIRANDIETAAYNMYIGKTLTYTNKDFENPAIKDAIKKWRSECEKYKDGNSIESTHIDEKTKKDSTTLTCTIEKCFVDDNEKYVLSKDKKTCIKNGLECTPSDKNASTGWLDSETNKCKIALCKDGYKIQDSKCVSIDKINSKEETARNKEQKKLDKEYESYINKLTKEFNKVIKKLKKQCEKDGGKIVDGRCKK